MLTKYIEKRFAMDVARPDVRARGRRVLLLVCLIILLSIGDLTATLIFLQSTGMQELNPFAAFVIKSGTPGSLVAFKMGSAFFCVSLILLMRHRRQGEFAAWVASCILIGLTCHWFMYTNQVLEFADTEILSEAQRATSWLTLDGQKLAERVP